MNDFTTEHTEATESTEKKHLMKTKNEKLFLLCFFLNSYARSSSVASVGSVTSVAKRL